MATGLWTAVSGAAAQAQNLDMIANNLANQDTLAYKKDLPTFKEYIATLERDKTSADIQRGPIKEKDLHPLDGRDQSFVVMDGSYTNFKQGNLRVTQGRLDLAMDGPGFFEVSTPNGIRYTRQGSLKLAMDGRLVTTEGYPVLAAQPGGLASSALPASSVQQGQGGLATQGGVAAEQGSGSEIAARFISLRDRGKAVTINTRGEIYAGDELVARMAVAEFRDSNQLRKQGGQLFESRDPSNRVDGDLGTQVRQGVLETSNVNPIEEMTNLIKANRAFEQDMKAMKTYGELMAKEVDIGRL